MQKKILGLYIGFCLKIILKKKLCQTDVYTGHTIPSRHHMVLSHIWQMGYLDERAGGEGMCDTNPRNWQWWPYTLTKIRLCGFNWFSRECAHTHAQHTHAQKRDQKLKKNHIKKLKLEDSTKNASTIEG